MLSKKVAPITPELSNWMSRLPASITCQPLNYIAIPGSHDSGTYCITCTSPPSPDGPIYPRVRHLPTLVAGALLHRWSRTQASCLVTQLRNGIRYLDLRVAVRPLLKKSPNKAYDFYLVHSQYAGLLEDEMIKVKEFLSEHPQEVVLLDCNHAYEFRTKEQHNAFEVMMMNIFGALLMPFEPITPSLDQLWAQKRQVILFSCLRGPNPSTLDRHFWPPSRINSLWPDTLDGDTMIRFLDAHYGPGSRRLQHNFCVHQGVLTPNVQFVLRHPFGSVRSLSQTAWSLYYDWLCAPERRAGKDAINITIVDFSVDDCPEYARAVINLNYKTWPVTESLTSESIPGTCDVPQQFEVTSKCPVPVEA